MYEFVDRPVTTLDDGGRFLVWSMRSWVCACNNDKCPAHTIGPAFARWKMIGGLQPFHQAMLILSHNALEKLQFCNLKCNHVSEHEAILLSLVCTVGTGDVLAARETLALILDEDWIGDCLGAFTELATALDGAGIAPGTPPRASRACDTSSRDQPKTGS